MSLSDSLRIRLPMIWLETEEFHHATEEVIRLSGTRTLFRFLGSFQMYHRPSGTWKESSGLLGTDQEDKPVYGPVDLDNLFTVLANETDAIFIHLLGEEFWTQSRYFTQSLFSFLTAWQQNDFTKTHCQVILMGPSDLTEKLPPSFRTYLVKESLDLPTEDEMMTLLRPLAERTHQVSDLRILARSLKGLGHYDALRFATADFANHGVLEHGRLTSAKIHRIKDTASLEIRAPQIKIDEIGGLDNAKDLIQSLAWCHLHPEDLERFHITPVRRVLMVGVPGTGKSAICEAAASAMGLELAKGGVSQAMNKFVGESERNVREMFKAVNAMSPVVFWIDEVARDLSGAGSSDFTDGGTTNRAHGEFLGGLQDLHPHVYLFGAANRIDNMPPEMLRADRWDKFFFVGLPSLRERIEIFAIHLGPEAAATMDLERLATATPTYTGAEIKALIRETRFWVGTLSAREGGPDSRHVTEGDLRRMITKHPLKGRVWETHRADIITLYKRAVSEWDWASSDQEENAHFIIDAEKHTGVPTRV